MIAKNKYKRNSKDCHIYLEYPSGEYEGFKCNNFVGTAILERALLGYAYAKFSMWDSTGQKWERDTNNTTLRPVIELESVK